MVRAVGYGAARRTSATTGPALLPPWPELGTTAETADKTDKTDTAEAEEAGVRALGKKVADEGTAGGASQPSREGGGRPAGARARTRTRSITDDPWDATSDRDDDDDDTTTNNNGGR